MMISIISINLNNVDGLTRTVESIFCQVFQDREVIIIDGGSTDGSRELLEKYSENIDYWVSEQDQGIYSAMNKGLDVARGEYVQFLNSGDWLATPDVLHNIFSHRTYSESILMGDYYRTISPEADLFELVPQQPKITLANFWRSGICHQSLFFKKELFSILGKYDEQYRIAADWDFTIRALLKGFTIRHLDFPVIYYAGGGISTTMVIERESEKEIMWNKLLPQSILHDYKRLQYLEGECCRLKNYENWVNKIQERSVLLNYTMVTKWFFKKWAGNLMRIFNRVNT
jgi:glycosyltransferase involved in cell wall biosynthesis